jgi:uncharacterized membrane protein YkvA (DUF1232 family)
MKILVRLQEAAQRIKHDAMTVYFAARDPRTPLVVRLLALFVAAYAISPIDLIPDFIPVLGYLDDVILLPLCIVIIIKMTPVEVINDSRAKAGEMSSKPMSYSAVVVIVIIWILCVASFGYWLWGVSGT